MITTSAIPAIFGATLLIVGFLVHSRAECEANLKHWLVQVFSSASYFAGFFLIVTSSYIWLSVTNNWQEPNSGSLTNIIFLFPISLTFFTTLVVDIRYRDFGLSITAIALGSTLGLMALSLVAWLIN